MRRKERHIRIVLCASLAACGGSTNGGNADGDAGSIPSVDASSSPLDAGTVSDAAPSATPADAAILADAGRPVDAGDGSDGSDASDAGDAEAAHLIAEYPILDRGLYATEMVLGPDAAIWFTNQRAIGHVTTAGVVTAIPLTSTTNTTCGNIVLGSDGNLWFPTTDKNLATPTISKMSAADQSITDFPLPSGADARQIISGPDGNIWFTTYGNSVSRMTLSGTITNFVVPTSGAQVDALTSGPDGNVWFSEDSTTAKIGRITTAGTITEFPPLPSSVKNNRSLAFGPDGNIWFAGYEEVGFMTTSGAATVFPDLGQPFEIVAASDGNLWFTLSSSHQIGRITVGGTITHFDLPDADAGSDSAPYGITVGADHNIWFGTPSKVGVLGLP